MNTGPEDLNFGSSELFFYLNNVSGMDPGNLKFHNFSPPPPPHP